jgi:hypothetical protein
VSKGIFANVLKKSEPRVDLDEIAPVKEEKPATVDLQGDYVFKEAAWRRNCLLLEKMEKRFEKVKSTLSNLDFYKLKDELDYQKMQTETSHKAMTEALRAYERESELNTRKWEAEQMFTRRVELLQSLQGLEERIEKASSLIQQMKDLIPTLQNQKNTLLLELSRLPSNSDIGVN